MAAIVLRKHYLNKRQIIMNNIFKINQTIVMTVVGIGSLYLMIGCKPRTTDTGAANTSTNTTIIREDNTVVNTNAASPSTSSIETSPSVTTLSPTSNDTNSLNVSRGGSTSSTTLSSAAVSDSSPAMSDADRAMLQQVQQEINGDANLSTSAKNVQINVLNGRITMKGFVGSQEEKDRLNALAVRIAGGADKVDNSLEVRSATTTP